MSRISGEQAEELSQTLRGALVEASIDGETRWVTMTEAPAVLRLLLLERNLISRDLLPRGRALLGPGKGHGLRRV